MTEQLRVVALEGLPELRPADPLGELLVEAVQAAGLALTDGDIVCVSQKVVSKAEGRIRELAGVEPTPHALDLAHRLGKDARLVQLILDESRSVLRAEHSVLIVETRSGWICANAGIDASNVPGKNRVTLLPEDGDRSARRIRAEVSRTSGRRPAIVISDSFGRPWRVGQTDVAIGCAGLAPLDDRRGTGDREGRGLTATVVAVADEVAAAADLGRGKDAGVPASVLRGLGRYVTPEDGPGAAPLRREQAEDLFR